MNAHTTLQHGKLMLRIRTLMLNCAGGVQWDNKASLDDPICTRARIGIETAVGTQAGYCDEYPDREYCILGDAARTRGGRAQTKFASLPP